MKNWGPRVGVAYSADDKTVFRAAFAMVYSHGGGTGGAGGAYNGPSQLGFTSSPAYIDGAAGTGAGPAFYLNTSSAFTALGLANANFGGPGYTVPAIVPPGAISQTLNVGNTVSSSGGFITASGAPGYADPYFSGRAPEFNFWNVGIQREITKNITVMANYTGSQSHFIAGASNMRGLQAGQINPIYYALGTLADSAGHTRKSCGCKYCCFGCGASAHQSAVSRLWSGRGNERGFRQSNHWSSVDLDAAVFRHHRYLGESVGERQL